MNTGKFTFVLYYFFSSYICCYHSCIPSDAYLQHNFKSPFTKPQFTHTLCTYLFTAMGMIGETPANVRECIQWASHPTLPLKQKTPFYWFLFYTELKSLCIYTQTHFNSFHSYGRDRRDQRPTTCACFSGGVLRILINLSKTKKTCILKFFIFSPFRSYGRNWWDALKCTRMHPMGVPPLSTPHAKNSNKMYSWVLIKNVQFSQISEYQNMMMIMMNKSIKRAAAACRYQN